MRSASLLAIAFTAVLAAVFTAVLAATVACGGGQALRMPPAASATPATPDVQTVDTPVAAAPAGPPGVVAVAEPTTDLTDSILGPDFVRDVKPLLARTCAPCHVPGGKMYDRLPFDNPKTVVSAQAGILRRLKGDDHEVVARWIASQPEPR